VRMRFVVEVRIPHRQSCPCSHNNGKSGNKGIATRIINLNTRWRWVVSFTLLPLYFQESRRNSMSRKIELKVKELYWLLGRKSQLSIENKLLMYKTIIKPIWTYDIEIWGCASKSSQAILQKAQSKIQRMITNASWYVSNLTLHEDLQIP